MEKRARSKGNIFSSFLPRATSVTFHNPPISPGRDMRPENWNRLKANAGKGFSGPVISIIPAEARRKSRSGNFDAEEPTSPKVSCMGQIKHKHKHKQKKLKNKNQKKLISKPNTLSEPRDFCKLESSPREEKKKPSSAILRIFGNWQKSDNPDVLEDLDTEAPVQVQVQGRAPSLGHMKRFASGRDSLANFDWSAQIPVSSDDQNYHGDGGDTGGEGGKMA